MPCYARIQSILSSLCSVEDGPKPVVAPVVEPLDQPVVAPLDHAEYTEQLIQTDGACDLELATLIQTAGLLQVYSLPLCLFLPHSVYSLISFSSFFFFQCFGFSPFLFLDVCQYLSIFFSLLFFSLSLSVKIVNNLSLAISKQAF
mgnify:CR=1 FL=1